jgi:uncharacterized membrane protein
MCSTRYRLAFFVAALIFDILYFNTFTMLWVKAAAWLISIGLVFAIIPQLINLGRTWFGKGRVRTRRAWPSISGSTWSRSSPRS